MTAGAPLRRNAPGSRLQPRPRANPEAPSVDLRVLPLTSVRRIASGSFVMLGFGHAHPDEHVRTRDVVSLESLRGALYAEGEIDTYESRRVFQVLQRAALTPVDSGQLIRQLAEQPERVSHPEPEDHGNQLRHGVRESSLLLHTA